MRFLPPKSLVSGGRNACPARVPCLFGSSGMLVAEENRAFRLEKQRFRPSETLSFFYFKCPYFAIALYLRRMRKIASVFSDGRAMERKYRILGRLAMQSVKMSTVGCRRARWADGCRRAVEKTPDCRYGFWRKYISLLIANRRTKLNIEIDEKRLAVFLSDVCWCLSSGLGPTR